MIVQNNFQKFQQTIQSYPMTPNTKMNHSILAYTTRNIQKILKIII